MKHIFLTVISMYRLGNINIYSSLFKLHSLLLVKEPYTFQFSFYNHAKKPFGDIHLGKNI